MSLSPQDVALVLIDIQPGIIDNSHTQSPRKLKIAAETAVKCADILGIPAFASVVALGPSEPKPVSELESLPVFARHGAATFEEPGIRAAVAATGRKTLALGGIVTEIAVLHGALSAIREGYTVHILLDCCGGLSDRTEHAALRQMEQAGALLSSVPSFYTTIAGDFTKPEAAKMMQLIHSLLARE